MSKEEYRERCIERIDRILEGFRHDCQSFQKLDYLTVPEVRRQILSMPELAKYFREGYVKLDPDQSHLSSGRQGEAFQPYCTGYEQAQRDMHKAGFKRIKEK
mgnify:CR=1 FL=1